MLSVEERRVLHQIERGLRHDDRLFPVQLALLRTRAALRRRTVRVILAVETALVALAVWGAVIRQPALIIPAVGMLLLLPILAIPRPARAPDSADPPAGTPPRLGAP